MTYYCEWRGTGNGFLVEESTMKAAKLKFAKLYAECYEPEVKRSEDQYKLQVAYIRARKAVKLTSQEWEK